MDNYKSKLKEFLYKDRNQNPNCAYGIITAVNESLYTCDILVLDNVNQNAGHKCYSVPLPMISGMSYSLPHNGDRVLVEFLGSGQNNPLVVAVYPNSGLQIHSATNVEKSNLEHYSD